MTFGLIESYEAVDLVFHAGASFSTGVFDHFGRLESLREHLRPGSRRRSSRSTPAQAHHYRGRRTYSSGRPAACFRDIPRTNFTLARRPLLVVDAA
jgi:hypothetical protein